MQKVCVDAVTGRWRVTAMWVYQCRINTSAARERIQSACLDIMISPGVCSAPLPDTHSGTMIWRLICLFSPDTLE